MRDPYLKELSMGDIFDFRGQLYILIDTYTSFNVLSLSRYTVSWIDPSEFVTYKGSMKNIKDWLKK